MADKSMWQNPEALLALIAMLTFFLFCEESVASGEVRQPVNTTNAYKHDSNLPSQTVSA